MDQSNNAETEIEEGDLQAYLEGERTARVEAALARSPKLRDLLAQLERANQRLHRLFANANVPAAHDMIDVAAGQATSLQQLRVAAYLRESPEGRRKMAFLLEGQSFEASASALVMAIPALVAQGTKSATPRVETVFTAPELDAQVVLDVYPYGAKTWSVSGYLEQHGGPLRELTVTLCKAGGRRNNRTTDTGGFFTFDRLTNGSYYLRVDLPEGILLTPPLPLSNKA